MATTYNNKASNTSDNGKSASPASGLKVVRVQAQGQEKILIASAEKVEKFREKLAERYGAKALETELRAAATTQKRRAEIEKQLSELRIRLDTEATSIAMKSEDAYYKQATIAEKRLFAQKREQELKARAITLDTLEQDELATAKTAAEKQAIEQNYQKLRLENIAEIQKAEIRSQKLVDAERKHLKALFNAKELADLKKADSEKAKQRAKELLAERNAKLAEATTKAEKRAIRDEYNPKINEQGKAAAKDAVQSELLNAIDGLKDMLSDSLKEVDQYMSTFYQYQSSINARLQGSDTTYTNITKMLTKNLGLSPFVSQRKYIENLNTLVDAGIAYNIEQRTFLATIAEKVATTFDAANGTLLRLIRIQQADTTAARIGIEAGLTRFFNNMFEDTSYLSDVYDTVSEAIIDANSQLSRDESAAFEYTVQKWLGSLSSVGMSSGSIQTIAQGLNYLATGDVNSLASNDGLQTLLAMSSSKAGLSYSDMLVNGLNAATTNMLLEKMVGYLQEIAESDNQVIKAQYGNMFNLSLSDMKAISNLTQDDISSISNSSMSYQQAIDETANQVSQIGSRMHIGELISNVYENAITTAATSVANNPATYVLWLVNDFIEQATGGINIPFVNAMGFGVDLNANINQLAKLLVIGVSTMGEIGNIISSLGGGGMSLNNWDAGDFTSRGTGAGANNSTRVTQTTSASAYVGNKSSDDAYKSTLMPASDSAEDTAEITNKNIKAEYTIDDVWKGLFLDGSQVAVLIKSDILDSIFEKTKLLDTVIENEGAVIAKVTAANDKLSIIHTDNVKLLDQIDDIYASIAQAKISKVEVTNPSLNVTALVDQISDNLDKRIKLYVEKTLISMLAESVSSSLTGGTDNASDGYTLADLIRKIIDDKVNVNVANDGFDTYISSKAFIGD